MHSDPTITSSIQRATSALEVLVRELVNHPEQVRVLALEGQHAVLYEISVKTEDICQVIGKGGRTVHALRELMRNLGARIERRFIIEVADPVSQRSYTLERAKSLDTRIQESKAQRGAASASPAVTYRKRPQSPPGQPNEG